MAQAASRIDAVTGCVALLSLLRIDGRTVVAGYGEFDGLGAREHVVLLVRGICVNEAGVGTATELRLGRI